MEDTHPVFGLFICAVFVAIGCLCLLRPEWIQRRALDSYDSLPRWWPFQGYVRSALYLPVTRVAGAIAVAIGVLIAVGYVVSLLLS